MELALLLDLEVAEWWLLSYMCRCVAYWVCVEVIVAFYLFVQFALLPVLCWRSFTTQVRT